MPKTTEWRLRIASIVVPDSFAMTDLPFTRYFKNTLRTGLPQQTRRVAIRLG